MSVVATRKTRMRNDADNDNQENNMIEEGEGDGKRTILKYPESSYPVDRGDGPPVDDCCPICFGTFSVPCKSQCGHWYCGSCILQHWKYSTTAYKPCKCPMCSSTITKLTPKVSLLDPKEREVVKVLQDVGRYNRIFAGGVHGLVEKVSELPFLIKRMIEEMMDPDGRNEDLHITCMKLFAMMLAILYIYSPFDFIPVERGEIVGLFDLSAVFLSLILQLVGIYRRWRRNRQRVRLLPDL